MLPGTMDHTLSLIYVIDAYAYIDMCSLFFSQTVIYDTTIFYTQYTSPTFSYDKYCIWFVVWTYKPSYIPPFCFLWITIDTQKF